MEPEAFKAIQHSLNLSDKRLAKALRLSSERNIRRMKNGDMAISGPISRLMELFDGNEDFVNELIDSESLL